MENIQQDPLEIVLRLLPLTNVIREEGEIRFRFKSEARAKYFESIALGFIIANRLPVVTDVETWSSRGIVHEASLVITYAPALEELP